MLSLVHHFLLYQPEALLQADTTTRPTHVALPPPANIQGLARMPSGGGARSFGAGGSSLASNYAAVIGAVRRITEEQPARPRAARRGRPRRRRAACPRRPRSALYGRSRRGAGGRVGSGARAPRRVRDRQCISGQDGAVSSLLAVCACCCMQLPVAAAAAAFGAGVRVGAAMAAGTADDITEDSAEALAGDGWGPGVALARAPPFGVQIANPGPHRRPS